jgi:hypothetical protein
MEKAGLVTPIILTEHAMAPRKWTAPDGSMMRPRKLVVRVEVEQNHLYHGSTRDETTNMKRARLGQYFLARSNSRLRRQTTHG